jgi:hypothetical protein
MELTEFFFWVKLWLALGVSYAIVSMWYFRKEIFSDYKQCPICALTAITFVIGESALAWPYFMYRQYRLNKKLDEGDDQQ